jgi:hypothetical protein
MRSFTLASIPRLARVANLPCCALKARALSGAAQPSADQHPWLAKVPAPPTFKSEERVLTFLAGASNAETGAESMFISVLVLYLMEILVQQTLPLEISRALKGIGPTCRMQSTERAWKLFCRRTR